MNTFNIETVINDQPVQVIKRNAYSPALENGVLYIDDLGIAVQDVDFTREVVLTLRIKPVPGTVETQPSEETAQPVRQPNAA